MMDGEEFFNAERITNFFTALANKYPIKFVILHWSFATGKSRKDSDIDLALAAEKKLDFKTELEIFGDIELARLFPSENELDIKFLNHADPLFRYQVTRDGKLLYGNKTDFEEYKAVSARMYEDAKSLRDLEKILINKYQLHLNKVYA